MRLALLEYARPPFSVMRMWPGNAWGYGSLGLTTERTLDASAGMRSSRTVSGSHHTRKSGNPGQRSSAQHGQGFDFREIPVVRHQGVGVDGDCTRHLNRIRKLEFQGGAKPSRAFGNVRRQIDHLPRFHHRAIALGERFLAGAQRSGQDLGDRRGRHREKNVSGRLPVKQRLKTPSEPGMCFQNIDDGCRIDQHQRTRRECRQV